MAAACWLHLSDNSSLIDRVCAASCGTGGWGGGGAVEEDRDKTNGGEVAHMCWRIGIAIDEKTWK